MQHRSIKENKGRKKNMKIIKMIQLNRTHVRNLIGKAYLKGMIKGKIKREDFN